MTFLTLLHTAPLHKSLVLASLECSSQLFWGVPRDRNTCSGTLIHHRHRHHHSSHHLSHLYFFFFNKFIYLFLAVLGLRFCVRAFSSSGKRGPLFIAASPIAEHRLQTRRLSSCGPRAQPLCGMWDLPRPGLEPMCPALAGRFSTTAPPGKPPHLYFVPSNLHD